MPVPLAVGAFVVWATSAFAPDDGRVQLTFDSSEADQVLAILALRKTGRPIDVAQWQRLFGTEPYRRLKARDQAIAERFKAPGNAFTDDDFEKFVVSDDLMARASELESTLERWRKADLRAAAERVLRYLPASAAIKAKVFPVIKPNSNSFVWETSTDPAIFLYVDPDVSGEKLANTVAHELHHIGLASAQADYDERIKALPERAGMAAEWVAAFGEGLAMLAAAGGPDADPHAASNAAERARWEHDLANFDADLRAVDAFLLDVLAGKLPDREAVAEKGSSFFGAQGPWYTVGYRMAVMVEKRFGRDALVQTMLEPRRLLVLYNQAAAEQNAAGKAQLPLWSEDVLEQVRAGPVLAAESDKPLEDWVAQLGATDPGLREEAQKRVVDAGARAVPALVAALETASAGPFIKEACWALYLIGPPAKDAAPTLETLLATRPPAERTIIAALANVDPKRGRLAVPELGRCALEQARPAWERRMCARILGQVGGAESAPTLLAVLADEDAELRATAAYGLRTAPADKARGALEGRLRDPALRVRVRAASSLLALVPDPPASALATLLEGACQGTGEEAELVASTLAEIKPMVRAGAEEALVASLRGGVAECRTGAAISLGRIAPRRAVPAIGLLRQALASEDGQLRAAAAWTLANMGTPARAALADLEKAAHADPLLEHPLQLLESRGPGADTLRLQDLRLMAVGKREGVTLGYLVHDGGNVWEVKQGQRLLDGTVERVDGETVELLAEIVADDFSLKPSRFRLKLFEKGEPAPLTIDPEFDGAPISVDLDADVTSLASLAGQFSGLNVVVEAGARGKVRLAARNAPWDGLVERALAGGGFGYKLDRGHLRIGRRDQLEKLRPLSSKKFSGHPINFTFHDGDLRDIARLYADISGLSVDLPSGHYEPVTIVARELPWDEALDMILASQGLTWRIDGDHLRIEAPAR